LALPRIKFLQQSAKNRKQIIVEILEKFVYWILEKGGDAMKELEGLLLKYRQS